MPLPLAFMALLYAFFTQNKKRGKRVAIASFIFLYLISNQILSDQIVKWWEGLTPYPNISKTYKVGVVLTGGMTKYYSKKNDIVGEGFSSDRAVLAFQLYKQGKIQNILITGGVGTLRDPQKGVSEGQSTKILLHKMGVDSAHIFLETEAVNTRANAVNSAKILKEKFQTNECLLITSAFHLPRSVGCFRKVGINVVPVPCHYLQRQIVVWFDKLAPDEVSLCNFYYIWHEAVGYLVYKISGYV